MTRSNGNHPFVIEDPDAATGPRTGLPVVVIGAGPVGLAAAAHLLDRGLEPLVLEAGPQVGATSPSGGTYDCSPPGAWPWTRSACACSSRLAGPVPTPTPCPPGPTCLSAT